LRWTEVDGAQWELPAKRSKNKRAHLVPLVPTVVDLLAAMCQRRSKNRPDGGAKVGQFSACI
jgi:hypothetical protein